MDARHFLATVPSLVWLTAIGFGTHGSLSAVNAESPVAPTAAVVKADDELFETSIRPALIEHCYECHSGDTIEAGLDLSHRDGLLLGGESGPAIAAGSPSESLLIKAMSYDEELKMPPDQRLPKRLRDQFARWIEHGAYDPRVPQQTSGESPPADEKATIDWSEARQAWALQPVRQQSMPEIERTDWPQRRHDHFVLAKMETHDLQPTPAADLQTLALRLAIDVTGLPPSDEQRRILATGADGQLDERALSRYIDHLMASPQFGERWARVWLDLARYAEDQAHIVGNNKALFYPNAYLYRDWVINAFNRDLAYDQFIRLQLAADLITDSPHSTEPVSRNDRPDSEEDPDAIEAKSQRENHGDSDLAALGFLGLGPKYYDRGRLAVKAEEWEDRVDTVARSFLGLTVACARCHDHKFDPVTTEDYYRLASVFASTKMYNRPLDDDVEQNKRGDAKEPVKSMHIVRDGEPTDLAVFIRGNVESPGAKTHRGFLTVLSHDSEPLLFLEGSGRRELADAIASSENPLTARVFVNRVWGQLIGQPIVATPSNFGRLGEPPTHPNLLDDLSFRFIQNGWSLKWLVREIVSSATYCQATMRPTSPIAIDPENRWLSRMHRKRLTAEAWRDRLLFVSRRLDSTVGGPSIEPDHENSMRRTVYSAISRFQLNPMLATFDVPDANVHSESRVATTTPQQRLLALNHPFVLKQATAITDEMLNDNPPSADQLEQVLSKVYARVLGRRGSPTELKLGRSFVRESTGPTASIDRDRLTGLIHALMASNELLFID